MKTIVTILFLSISFLNPLTAGGETGDRELIARVVEDSIGWFKTKDFGRLFEIFPDDPELVLISPNFNDTVIGGKAFRDGASLWRDPANFYLRHQIKDLRITISRSGTVAWWSALLDDCGSYGGQEHCWLDCRFTGVAEKRNGKWVIAQCHYSFGADKVAEKIRTRNVLTDEKFSDYSSLRKRVGELFTEKNYAVAANLLKKSLDQFPEKTMANIYNLTLASLFLDDLEKAIYWLEEGHRRGLFFGIWDFEGEPWSRLAPLPRFQDFLKENRQRILAAQASSKMKFELVKPPGFEARKKYPLFIALHGGGERIEDFKPRWTSPVLQEEFVVAYVQSSQVADMKGFHWQDEKTACRDLAVACREIASHVSIDPERIYIGGFSSGGYGALVALFAEAVPARGFVILCPPVPAGIAEPVLQKLGRQGVRGTLITSGSDPNFAGQKSLAGRMEQAGLPVRLVVVENTGHWYPDNLPRLIDEALKELSR